MEHQVNPRLIEAAQRHIIDRLNRKLEESGRQRDLQRLRRREAQAAELRDAGSTEVSRVTASQSTAVAVRDEFQPLQPPTLDHDELVASLRVRLKRLENKFPEDWTTRALGQLLLESEAHKLGIEFRTAKFRELDERLAALEGRG